MRNIQIGDKVRYYCNSQMCLREGTVTAVDVEVMHLWAWEQSGTVINCPNSSPKPGAVHPLGVEINGSLTRQYYGSGSGVLHDYDKTRAVA